MLTDIVEAIDAVQLSFENHFITNARVGRKVKEVGNFDLLQDPNAVPTPCIAIDFESFDSYASEDGRMGVDVTFTAYAILSYSTENVQKQIRQFAIEIANLVRDNRWSIKGSAERPINLNATPGPLQPGINGYESWAVQWQQTFSIGGDRYAEDGTPITEAAYLVNPEEGTESEDYEIIPNE